MWRSAGTAWSPRGATRNRAAGALTALAHETWPFVQALVEAYLLDRCLGAADEPGRSASPTACS
jgi:hypothetical protein